MRVGKAFAMAPEISLTDEEERLLARHLRFYRDLASGRRKPMTTAQEHFVKATVGHTAAETPHEWAYIKYKRLQARNRSKSPSPRDPEIDGPTPEWFTRDDWKKSRGRQRWDGR